MHAPGNVQAREDLVDHHTDEPGEDHDTRGVHERNAPDGRAASAQGRRDGREEDRHGKAASGDGVIVKVGDFFHGPVTDVDHDKEIQNDDRVIQPMDAHGVLLDAGRAALHDTEKREWNPQQA